MAYRDLRVFIDEIEHLGELRRIDGADPNLEIGTITEVAAESSLCPMLMFDNIKGYPAGHRLMTNMLHTTKRLALALGLPVDIKGIDFVRAWKDKLSKPGSIPPVKVKSGPFQENVFSGKDANLLALPSIKWHELDGGPYLGTGAITIMRDPDSGYVNFGIYRSQVYDRSAMGVNIEKLRHGMIIAEKYWAAGKNCPVTVCSGFEPSIFVAGALQSVPFGVCEYDVAGWLRGEPVDVVESDLNGLPLPATAEIVIEGEMPPLKTGGRLEGPFGEATGYYASGAKDQPVINVKRIMYRNNPILHGAPPMKPLPGLFHWPVNWRSASIWSDLERAGLFGIKGVWMHGISMVTVAIDQSYPGQSKEVLMAAAGSRNAETVRVAVVVDSDIDITNISDVMWAVSTRCDAAESIDIIRNHPAIRIDPRMSPEDRKNGNYVLSQALVDACRPYPWKDKFPPVSGASAELKAKALKKWGHLLR